MPFDQPMLPATRELFERYGAMVYRRCAAILGRDELARDAVQDVFLRVHERRYQFRGEAAPSTWLYTVATMHCLRQLRDHKSHRQKLEQLAEEPPRAAPAALDDRLAIVRLLDGESEEVALMVYLHYVDGMTMDEVAEAVGYSRKTVSKRVHAFLAAARVQLQAEGNTR